MELSRKTTLPYWRILFPTLFAAGAILTTRSCEKPTAGPRQASPREISRALEKIIIPRDIDEEIRAIFNHDEIFEQVSKGTQFVCGQPIEENQVGITEKFFKSLGETNNLRAKTVFIETYLRQRYRHLWQTDIEKRAFDYALTYLTHKILSHPPNTGKNRFGEEDFIEAVNLGIERVIADGNPREIEEIDTLAKLIYGFLSTILEGPPNFGMSRDRF